MRCFWAISLGLSLFGFTLASGSIIQQDVSLGVLASSTTKSVILQSCDGQPLYAIFSGNIRPNQKKDICLLFINPTAQDVSLQFGFTDTSLTAERTLACKSDFNTGSFFSSIRGYGTSLVLVPASGFVLQRFTLQAPLTGSVQGCLSYQSLNDHLVSGMFNIVLRKTIVVDMPLIGSEYTYWDLFCDRFSQGGYSKMVWSGIFLIFFVLLLLEIRKSLLSKK